MPVITYQYEVGGQTYQNKTFNLEQLVGVRGGTFQSEAEAKAAQYPVGKAIEVFYNSARPERSVLDRSTPQGVLWFAYGMAAFGLFFVSCGGIVWIARAFLTNP